MKKGSLITLFILSLFAVSMLQVSSAQTPTAGISEGDVFFYDISFTWNSTDPTVPIPEEYLLGNVQEWLCLNITSVNGSTVHMESTLHYKNGTEVIEENSYINAEK